MKSDFRSVFTKWRASFHATKLAGAAWAFTAFFLILCSYYVLRPVRDEMAVQYGADNLHRLFTGTFLLMLITVPAFGWLVKRLPRALVLPATYGFFISNLAGFCLLFGLGAASAGIAAAFFMWVSVFNLFAVSLFWSSVGDSFTTAESHRLYGYIAAGGTSGALAGPAVTAVLAQHVSTAYLVGMSALLLAGATVCMVRLRRRRPASAQDAQDPIRPIGGSVAAGISLTLRPGTLRNVALLVICYTALSTVLYVEMVNLVGKTYSGAGERKAFFASLDLAVNGLSLLLQMLGTRRLVERHGLRLALSALPAVMLAGLGVLTVCGSLMLFAMVQTAHRVGEYAINRPGREMVYTTVDAESRYKAKNFIDTAVYRANDAASAWLIAMVRSMGLDAVVFIGIPAAIAWLLIGFKVGKKHDELRRARANEPVR
ncbi:MAG: Major Facilitator Superfamily protein [Noviherbaspirillum sp.]|nr:Major Facilitator Superfamily protein [Noviherbaspirillum sp.]